MEYKYPAFAKLFNVSSNVMTNPEIIVLKNIDPEDISDVLAKIEKSFHIKFGQNELKNVKTFGELCDIVTSKIHLDSIDDCTTQQAFYKIKHSIQKNLKINSVTPNTDIENVFPRTTRKTTVRAIEEDLGFRFNLLRPKHWVSGAFILFFLLSLISFLFDWKIAISGLVLSITGIQASNYLGKEMDIKTVGELAEIISREHYLKSRRKSSSVNNKEIFKKVQDLFSNDLGLDLSILTKDATFS